MISKKYVCVMREIDDVNTIEIEAESFELAINRCNSTLIRTDSRACIVGVFYRDEAEKMLGAIDEYI